jgi:hypothetical protein
VGNLEEIYGLAQISWHLIINGDENRALRILPLFQCKIM